MKIQEAIKIITGYMGFKDFTEKELTFNPCSLDALVAVWEKSGLRIYVATFYMGFWSVTISTEAGNGKQRDVLIKDRQKTIQQAACIATAKAIQELA